MTLIKMNNLEVVYIIMIMIILFLFLFLLLIIRKRIKIRIKCNTVSVDSMPLKVIWHLKILCLNWHVTTGSCENQRARKSIQSVNWSFLPF